MTIVQNNQLSISPIGWINDDDPSLGSHISLEQCLNEIKESGFNKTELGSKFPTDKYQLKKILIKHKLSISSAWFSAFFTENKTNETVKRFINFMSRMQYVDAKVINICECGYSYHQKNEPILSTPNPPLSNFQWKLLIKGLHSIGRIASDFGMQLSYHFHLGTVIQTQENIDELMLYTSPSLIGLLLDTGHAHCAGINIDNIIKKHGERINQVHLKDVREKVLKKSIQDKWSFMNSVREGLFTVPGDGSIDFKSIFKQLKDINYKGFYVVEAEQDPKKAPPLKKAKQALETISQAHEEI